MATTHHETTASCNAIVTSGAELICPEVRCRAKHVDLAQICLALAWADLPSGYLSL